MFTAYFNLFNAFLKNEGMPLSGERDTLTCPVPARSPPQHLPSLHATECYQVLHGKPGHSHC
jgi:hypothetical protein